LEIVSSDQVKMRPLGWTLIQYAVSLKMGNLGTEIATVHREKPCKIEGRVQRDAPERARNSNDCYQTTRARDRHGAEDPSLASE
jgi:hypothetical protein